jgi:UPF0755 protein
MYERRIIKRLLIQVGVVFGSTFAILLYILFWLPNSFDPSPRFITISKGQSFASVVDSLSRNGIIFNRFTFKLAGRLLGVTQKIRVGKYSFVSGVSNYEILKDIESGLSTISLSITFREGIRTNQYARILHHLVGIDSARFMEIFRDTSLIGIYPHHSTSLEGYLLPETYEFYWQDDEQKIIQTLITEFREFFVDSLQQRMKALKYDLNDVITMASIIEAEAVHDDERPIIAGVYYNRLKKGMRLQADPTVAYIVADSPRRIFLNDLKVESPYNTYIYFGLPPGPINNPGRQSILAALYPAKHNYIYFVSDHNGRHRFARTYNEHLRNVRLHRKARALARNG